MVSILLALLSSSSLWAQGFSSGNEFVATELHGSITVFCRSGASNETAEVYCDTEILDPTEFDYFVSDENIDADVITLSTVVNNKVVKKTLSFNQDKKRSKQMFNLWIRTITQTPLLDYGQNVVTYKLSKNKQVVKEGQFTVNVSVGKSRYCPHGIMSSPNPSDCRGGGFVCNDYFRNYNYCQ